MVSRLVAEDEGNRTLEEEIVSSSKGPDISERVQMAVSEFILIPFSTIFIAQLAPLSLLSPYVSLCFPI